MKFRQIDASVTPIKYYLGLNNSEIFTSKALKGKTMRAVISQEIFEISADQEFFQGIDNATYMYLDTMLLLLDLDINLHFDSP